MFMIADMKGKCGGGESGAGEGYLLQSLLVAASATKGGSSSLILGDARQTAIRCQVNALARLLVQTRPFDTSEWWRQAGRRQRT